MDMTQRQTAELIALHKELGHGAFKALVEMGASRDDDGWIEITPAELAAILGCSRSSAYKYLADLVSKGKIAPHPKGERAGYRLLPAGR